MTEANGRGKSEAAIEMVDRFSAQHRHHPTTMGSDKRYDDGSCCIVMESPCIVPHGAMARVEAKQGSAAEKRRPNALARCRLKERQETQEYGVSRKCRKKIKECIGWIQCVTGIGSSRHIGRWKIRQQLQMSAAELILVRFRK
ncbi:MAG: hypothetical protein P8J37_00270 [Fuerstiella sp.]|nr:hypothetical protein [Fuerstiella sp.]